MNVHHLELFYYVAKHGGISEAVRNIPYGIQQPAVSGQILQLEEFLGATLFHRRPFELTTAGQELFDFINPFFARLEIMTLKLQGGSASHIRIGAAEVVLREHIPVLSRMVRKKFPRLKLILREGYQPQVIGWLEKQEIDLAVTLLDDKPPPGLNHFALLSLPLMLLVAKDSPIKSADELWRKDRIAEGLIALTANEPICRHFQKGLARKGIDWFPSIEVSSFDLIETYVVNGDGIGLFLHIPKAKISDQVRPLPLDPEVFMPVTVVALWRGKSTPLIDAFLESFQWRARQLAG